MAVRLQLRRGTAAQWTSANPTLLPGEVGLETDTGLFKTGNGSTAWTSLSYGGFSGTATLTQIDLNGGTDIGAAIVDTDALAVYDASATANRKTDASRIPTYVFSKVSGDVTVDSSGVAAIGSGVIVNADINNSAAIALSKLATGALPTAITVASANIVDGTIVNADIHASAAINTTKITNWENDQVVLSGQIFS